MTGDSKSPAVDLDSTDELPVLTEETILQIEALGLGESDADLESVDTLRAALETAESRWLALEQRLEAQNQAIADLQRSLLDVQRPIAADWESEPVPVPEVTMEPATAAESERDEAAPGQRDAAPAEVIAEPATADLQVELAFEPTDDAAIDSLTPAVDGELLERIATLEAYIAGRADRWRDMEQELQAKSQRIAELEAELEQRIAREQSLEQQVHDRSHKALELRDKLNRLNRRLESFRFGNDDADVEVTQEAPAARLNAVPPTEAVLSSLAEPRSLPELICLTSDTPQRHVLDKPTITIGRSGDCDIQVVTHFVSREHARIRRDNGALVIEDHSSTNGVFVNAQRVDSKRLEHGDWITIGETQFRFLSGDAVN